MADGRGAPDFISSIEREESIERLSNVGVPVLMSH